MNSDAKPMAQTPAGKPRQDGAASGGGVFVGGGVMAAGGPLIVFGHSGAPAASYDSAEGIANILRDKAGVAAI